MADHTHQADDGAVHVHIHPTKFYAGILLALLTLTVLTVAASYLDIDGLMAMGAEVEGVGAWNLALAMAIATVKATLVLLFFMHLKDDNRFNGVIVLVALLFVGIFFFYTYNDTSTRGDVDPFNGVHVDPETGVRAPGGLTGIIEGEAIPDGIATEPPATGAALGAQLFSSQGCSACHVTEAGAPSTVGPNLAGISGAPQTLADGSEVTADEVFLRESIVDPSATIIGGFESAAMPPFAGLNDEQLDALVAYIGTLGAAE